MRAFLILLSLVASLLPCPAQELRWDNDRLDNVDNLLQEFVRSGEISGAVTLTATADRIVQVTTTGLADISAVQPMQRNTIFRIASMTKLVTATALMQLVQQGLAAPDDPIEKYLPAFGSPKLQDGTSCRAITIRDIMTHTAGLERSSGIAGDRTLQQEVDEIGRRPLRFEPGTRWEYSSGLTVAGRLVEVLSGLSLQDYFQQRIFQPLGMVDTTFVLSEKQAERLAVTYRPGTEAGKLAEVEIPDPTLPRMPNPSGGLYSTADDMAKFAQAILKTTQGKSSTLLSTDAAEQMLTPQTGELITGFTPGNQWGLGWCMLQHPQGVTRLLMPGTFGHGGAWGTQLWIDRHRGVILILMIQRTGFGNSDGSDLRSQHNEAVLTALRGAASETAEFRAWHGYTGAVELRTGTTRAVLCPEAGGRVLEYSLNDVNAMYLDPREREWKNGDPPLGSAGRFDFGPELVVPAHRVIWSGAWTAEITGPVSARMVSQQDPVSGVQVIRDFELVPPAAADGQAATLSCRQTLVNISDRTLEYCHWGRSFSPGGGICVIPAGRFPGRFPAGYVMYEESAILNANNVDELIRRRDGFLEILAPPRLPKLGFDSYAGWLGYVMPGDHLFVKRFHADADRVYNEVAGLTVSVWYPQGREMIELEPIGPRERLQPGAAASFTEHWTLVPFPFPAADQSVDLQKVSEIVERLVEVDLQ